MSLVSPYIEPGLDLARRLMAQLRDPGFLPTIFPDLFSTGIDQGSVHAYVLSALVLVGDRLGFTPVCDSPIFDRLDNLLTGEGPKRPDAVWYARGTQTVRCLVEFERFTRQALVPKARNLLIMGKEQRDDLQLAVLNYWTYASAPELELQMSRNVFERGFTHRQGIAFPRLSCPALIMETLVVDRDGLTRIVGFEPRQFIALGESKPYAVESLTDPRGR